MKKDNFVEIVKAVKLLKGDLCVEINRPGNKFKEKQINYNEDLDNRMEFYLRDYDSNMVNRYDKSVFIESAYIIK